MNDLTYTIEGITWGLFLTALVTRVLEFYTNPYFVVSWNIILLLAAGIVLAQVIRWVS